MHGHDGYRKIICMQLITIIRILAKVSDTKILLIAIYSNLIKKSVLNVVNCKSNFIFFNYFIKKFVI
jgi:hypothetical protein